MKKNILLLFVCIYSVISFAQLQYPSTKTVDSSDTYFGETYKDPYRWLEKTQDENVKKWFSSQAELTNSILNKLSGQNELFEAWESLNKLKPTFYFNRSFANGAFIYQKEDPAKNNTNLYIRKSNNLEEVLIDTKLVIDSILGFSFSRATISSDGKKAILSFVKNGAEMAMLKILDIENKTILKDSIYPCFNEVSWCQDNISFIYNSLLTDDNKSSDFLKNNKVKLHHIGDNPSKDKIYLSISEYPELKISSDRRPSGDISYYSPNYIFANASNDDGILVSYFAPKEELNKAHLSWKPLSRSEDELINMVYKNDRVYAISKKNAKNYKLIATNLNNPNWAHAEIISEEKSDLVLEDFKLCKDYLLIVYSDGINCRLFKYNFISKKSNEVKLPIKGSVTIECINKNSNEVYVTIVSWSMPQVEYKLNVTTDDFTNSEFNKVAEYPKEFQNVEVEEIEIKGHDGVMIPLTILYKPGTKKDGNAICFMYSYGAYAYSMKPYFSITNNLLLNKGVIIAFPHVRGGGEKGELWYKGGFKTTKPNTWKDFNSCAEYLVFSKYTSAKKIIAFAGSMGGILVAGAINERPDLYGAAISGSGVLNSLRMEKMPNGDFLTGEIGTVKDSIECIALEKMDGLVHISKKVQYPAVVCYIGMNDPRVSPWQSAKFIAALQNLQGQSKPFLLHVDFNGGHGSSTRMYQEELSFALWQCGHPDFQMKK